MCYNGASKMHTNMMYRVARSKITFFDRNPSGRIINRFSNDIGILDRMLPNAGYEAYKNCITLCVTGGFLIYVNPILIISLILPITFLYKLTKYCKKAIEDTRIIEIVSRG